MASSRWRGERGDPRTTLGRISLLPSINCIRTLLIMGEVL